MAIDLTQKRTNWINTGMGLLFGSPGVQPTKGGFYAQTLALQAWVNEGVLAGFLANGATAATSPVLDTDFSGYPNINAAVFGTAIAALQTLNTDYMAVLAALVAIKP